MGGTAVSNRLGVYGASSVSVADAADHAPEAASLPTRCIPAAVIKRDPAAISILGREE